MHRPNTRSKQTAHPAPTQASKRKTRGSKATIDNNEPVNDPPPAKSGGRKPLRKTVEADKGDKEAIANSASEASQAPKNTSRPVPRKKVAEVAQDAPPDEDDAFTSPRRWGRNTSPPPPFQDPPHTETPPPPPAEAPSHTEGPPARAETPPHSPTQRPRAETPPSPPSKTPENEPEDPNDYPDKAFTPDMEDQDDDDLEAFESEISTNGGPKSKGKEKEGTKTPHKSGPIPNEAKEEAFALQATFRNGIEALAARIGKSPDTLYALIGEGAKIARRTVSLWGVFEAWYASEGAITKPKTMSAQDWAVVVAGEYEEYCKQKLQERWEDPMERAQLLQPMVKWYKERYDDFIDEKKVDGTFHKIIAKTRDEFMHS
ncbi:hypothetical protein DXG01_011590, partial [Tephrocybe rancida]